MRNIAIDISNSREIMGETAKQKAQDHREILMDNYQYDYLSLIKDYLNDTLQPISNYEIRKVTDVMPEFREIVSHVEHCNVCIKDSSMVYLFSKLYSPETSMLEYATYRDRISMRVGEKHTLG